MGRGPVSEITRNQERVTDLECDTEAVVCYEEGGLWGLASGTGLHSTQGV